MCKPNLLGWFASSPNTLACIGSAQFITRYKCFDSTKARRLKRTRLTRRSRRWHSRSGLRRTAPWLYHTGWKKIKQLHGNTEGRFAQRCTFRLGPLIGRSQMSLQPDKMFFGMLTWNVKDRQSYQCYCNFVGRMNFGKHHSHNYRINCQQRIHQRIQHRCQLAGSNFGLDFEEGVELPEYDKAGEFPKD